MISSLDVPEAIYARVMWLNIRPPGDCRPAQSWLLQNAQWNQVTLGGCSLSHLQAAKPVPCGISCHWMATTSSLRQGCRPGPVPAPGSVQGRTAAPGLLPGGGSCREVPTPFSELPDSGRGSLWGTHSWGCLQRRQAPSLRPVANLGWRSTLPHPLPH